MHRTLFIRLLLVLKKAYKQNMLMSQPYLTEFALQVVEHYLYNAFNQLAPSLQTGLPTFAEPFLYETPVLN